MEKLVAVLLLVSAAGAHAASFPCNHPKLRPAHRLRIDRQDNRTLQQPDMVPRQLLHRSWENQANHFIAQCLSNYDHLTILPTRRRHELLQIATNQHPEIHIPRRLLLRQLRRQSQPPVFDLSLGGQKWATVNSSATTDVPVFQELIYAPRNDNISVCLMGRKEYGSATPFISSLEATYLDEDETDINHSVYGMMRNGRLIILLLGSILGVTMKSWKGLPVQILIEDLVRMRNQKDWMFTFDGIMRRTCLS
ncbi:UNVERIFIED_CONTAM: hypothetical protein Scaly_3059000 [Sesamum calycinum]|uniref:Malectin-like domain-containing protein n=1 Tax=Sesamum calycinum TaxID=2727403 RepID=A0AAW2K054_9LAMI